MDAITFTQTPFLKNEWECLTNLQKFNICFIEKWQKMLIYYRRRFNCKTLRRFHAISKLKSIDKKFAVRGLAWCKCTQQSLPWVQTFQPGGVMPPFNRLAYGLPLDVCSLRTFTFKKNQLMTMGSHGIFYIQ